MEVKTDAALELKEVEATGEEYNTLYNIIALDKLFEEAYRVFKGINVVMHTTKPTKY